MNLLDHSIYFQQIRSIQAFLIEFVCIKLSNITDKYNRIKNKQIFRPQQKSYCSICHQNIKQIKISQVYNSLHNNNPLTEVKYIQQSEGQEQQKEINELDLVMSQIQKTKKQLLRLNNEKTISSLQQFLFDTNNTVQIFFRDKTNFNNMQDNRNMIAVLFKQFIAKFMQVSHNDIKPNVIRCAQDLAHYLFRKKKQGITFSDKQTQTTPVASSKTLRLFDPLKTSKNKQKQQLKKNKQLLQDQKTKIQILTKQNVNLQQQIRNYNTTKMLLSVKVLDDQTLNQPQSQQNTYPNNQDQNKKVQFDEKIQIQPLKISKNKRITILRSSIRQQFNPLRNSVQNNNNNIYNLNGINSINKTNRSNTSVGFNSNRVKDKDIQKEGDQKNDYQKQEQEREEQVEDRCRYRQIQVELKEDNDGQQQGINEKNQNKFENEVQFRVDKNDDNKDQMRVNQGQQVKIQTRYVEVCDSEIQTEIKYYNSIQIQTDDFSLMKIEQERLQTAVTNQIQNNKTRNLSHFRNNSSKKSLINQKQLISIGEAQRRKTINIIQNNQKISQKQQVENQSQEGIPTSQEAKRSTIKSSLVQMISKMNLDTLREISQLYLPPEKQRKNRPLVYNKSHTSFMFNNNRNSSFRKQRVSDELRPLQATTIKRQSLVKVNKQHLKTVDKKLSQSSQSISSEEKDTYALTDILNFTQGKFQTKDTQKINSVFSQTNSNKNHNKSVVIRSNSNKISIQRIKTHLIRQHSSAQLQQLQRAHTQTMRIRKQYQDYFDKSHLTQFFGSLQSAYSFESSPNIKYKLNTKYKKKHQLLVSNVYKHLQELKRSDNLLYHRIKEFIKFPYQSVLNQFGGPMIQSSISFGIFTNLMYFLLNKHESCQNLSKRIYCSHISLLLEKLEFKRVEEKSKFNLPKLQQIE